MRANQHLANAEVALTAGAAGPHQRLALALEQLHGYDFVLVDSPPSMGKLVLNALCAADHLLVPVTADYVSVGGVHHCRSGRPPDVRTSRGLGAGRFPTQVRRTLHARKRWSCSASSAGRC